MRVLVANRGEIALRVLRACREAGHETVAVYSDADKDSRWVELADTAEYLGASPAAKSYLNADAVLRAAVTSEADAVHPGYGPLAENARFAARAVEAGLRFIGPPPWVIERLSHVAREFAPSGSDIHADRARHVEVQVLADNVGTVLHAFERDCSVQWRGRKLVAQAPAPGLAPRIRAELTNAAVRLARYVGYRGVGTVEFLLGDSGAYRFVDMTSGIPLEHPVTELVTGVDLVAEQLRIASGKPLSVTQQDVVLDGAAVGVRIDAEDPEHGFLPDPGELHRVDLPGGPGVRVDSGVVSGDVVSPLYDSLLGKVSCWGVDREQALARACAALGEVRVDGVRTTAELHAALLRDPQLRGSPVSTSWLEGRLGGAGS